jgi:hypothetical protein
MKFNYDTLKKMCLAQITDFESLGEVHTTRDGMYIYKSTPKAKILGVAHLDTVLTLNHFHKITIDGQDIVFNAQLDDRLGVYTLLDVLPRLGIQFDLLLTEGEETGRSTSAHFETDKEYNWMFSFDRHGEDVVLYQYDTPSLRQVLQDSKFKIGIGSFSDIAFMEHLGIQGFNIGTGYEGEHDSMCYANMNILARQIARFVDFYQKNKDIPYPHKQVVSRWYTYDDSYCWLCGKNHGIHDIGKDLYLCEACFSEAGQCQDCFEIYYDYELTDGVCIDCLNKPLEDIRYG